MSKFKRNFSAGKTNIKCTRKELRKEKRMLKKKSKCLFYEKLKQKNKGNLKTSPGQFVKLKQDSCSSSEVVIDNAENNRKKSTKKVTFSDMFIKQDEGKTTNVPQKKNLKEKLQKQMQSQRKRQLLDAVKQDEKEIKTLEKRLKLQKRKNKSTSRGFVECGLDYILDVCDSERIQSAVNTEVNFEDSDDSDFMEDVSFVKGKITSEESNKEVSSKLKSVKEIDNTSTRENNIQSNLDTSESEESDNDFSETELNSESDGDSDNSLLNEQEEEDDHKENKFHEDIYGRLRDDKGNIIKQNNDKYIPPHLRVTENSEIDRAKKQLKGLLNRLAQSNMYSIANEIEIIYSKHSRHSINEIIIELILGNVITHVLSPERLIVDHALLIAIFHGNLGSEVGAYMLQRFVEHFDSLFSQEHEVENKELDNVVYLISYMYNFKIFEACLLYDILNKLCNNCSEKSIDLILIVLKSVGFSLRKDDPNLMKQFLLSAQKRFNLLPAEENSRMKYMLSVLINIKNNNIGKLSEFDSSQHEQLRKVLKTVIRKGNEIVALRIGLEDLLKVEERGRWWLVGSAWKSEDGVKTVQEVQNNPNKEKYSVQLLELAKKQRMNTDNRRNIFCILMTAEDYQDAFEKLLRLGLKGQQEREIPLVILQSLLQEKKFNPFYGLVAEQLCISDRRHQMTLQCALWDRFRDLQALKSVQIHILAQFLSQLLTAGSLPISVLKVVEFAELDKKHIRLLRQTILSIANEKNLETVKEIFIKVSKAKKLALFKEALKLFIHHFILRNMDEGDLRDRVTIISTILAEDR